MDSVCRNDDGVGSPAGHTVRIEWVDVFKAICIILMVFGHTWSGANSYIYQFHMAAFFFISGYTSNIWKHDLEKLVFRKIHVLIIPLIIMIILLSPLDHICGNGVRIVDSIVSVKDDFLNLLIHNTTVDLLGAAWFVMSLFQIFIIHRLIFSFTSRYGGLWTYLILTIALFMWGYYYNASGFVSFRLDDVTLVAQLYFGVGVFIRQKMAESHQYPLIALLSILIVSAAIVIIAGKIDMNTIIMFPERDYPSMIVMMTLPFAGIAMVYSFSEILCRLTSAVKKLLLIIGRETLGILFLHFAAFKIATLALMMVGKATADDLKLFLPSSIVGDDPVLITFYVATSVCTSVLIWKGLCRIPYLRWALGKDGAFAVNKT